MSFLSNKETLTTETRNIAIESYRQSLEQEGVSPKDIVEMLKLYDEFWPCEEQA